MRFLKAILLGGVCVSVSAAAGDVLNPSPIPNPGGVSPIVDSISPYGSPTYAPAATPEPSADQWGPRAPRLELPEGYDEEAPQYSPPLDPTAFPNPGGVSPIVDSAMGLDSGSITSSASCNESDAKCSPLIKIMCLYSKAFIAATQAEVAQIRQIGGQKNLPSMSGMLNLSASIARAQAETKAKFQADFDAAYQRECISGGLCANICSCEHSDKCMENCPSAKPLMCENFYKSFNQSFEPAGYLNEEPTGKVEMPTCQGSSGNCATLSLIESLLQTPEGKKIIEDSLHVNADGSVDVIFKGQPDKTYHILPTDLLMGDVSGTFSRGDADMRALELAVKQYFDSRGMSYEYLNQSGFNSLQTLLTGSDSGNFWERVAWDKGFQDGVIDKFNDPNTPRTAAINKDATIYDHNSGGNVTLLGEHQYTVAGSDQTYVYIKNPHDNTTPIAVSRSDFKNISLTIRGGKIN